MKTALIVIGAIIVYFVIGYAFAVCCMAWEEDDDIEDYLGIGACWIIFIPLFLLSLIAKFLGKRLAVIPVAIIALIKARDKK